MDRDLKRISHTKSYSRSLKRVVVLLFVVVLQAAFCFSPSTCDPKRSSNQVSSFTEKADLEKQSTNGDKRDRTTLKTNDVLKEGVKSEGQSPKLKDFWDTLKGSEQLARLKAFWGKLKRLSESKQRNMVQELGPSQAIELLKSAIKEGKLKLFKILLHERSFTSQEMLEALDQVVSLDKLSKKVLEMFNLLLRQPRLSLMDLCREDKAGVPRFHYVIVYSDIDTLKIILENARLDHLLNALCAKDKEGETSLHCLAMLGGRIDIWKTILKKIPVNALCAKDKDNKTLLDALCVQNKEGKTPLHYLAMFGGYIDIWTALVKKFDLDIRSSAKECVR